MTLPLLACTQMILPCFHIFPFQWERFVTAGPGMGWCTQLKQQLILSSHVKSCFICSIFHWERFLTARLGWCTQWHSWNSSWSCPVMSSQVMAHGRHGPPLYSIQTAHTGERQASRQRDSYLGFFTFSIWRVSIQMWTLQKHPTSALFPCEPHWLNFFDTIAITNWFR